MGELAGGVGVGSGGDAAAAAATGLLETALDAQIAEGLADLSNIDSIRESERAKPYIGDREPLEALKEEYANGAAVFVAKISALQARYGGMRRTRGDGNCFFRSWIYAHLERLLLASHEAEAQRFAQRLQGWKAKLAEAGYDAIVYEDPLELLLGLVHAIIIGPGVEGGVGGQQLLANFRDDTWSNTVVMLLRFITSAEIKRRAEHFAPFVLGQYEMDVAAFCERSVDVMGEESDHIHAQALTDAMQVPLRIIQVDSTDHGVGVEPGIVDMQPGALGGEGADAASPAPPCVHLLYRPGHYDILYPVAPIGA